VTNGAAPEVECEMHHPILPVADIRAAVEFYVQRLGFSEDFTQGEPPAFAAVTLGQVQVFLETGHASPGDTPCLSSWGAIALSSSEQLAGAERRSV
jgi:catechol 2,3-dioxygenase-like lactoylglutathione lyase family enzyme